jgi:hypothetical protein
MNVTAVRRYCQPTPVAPCLRAPIALFVPAVNTLIRRIGAKYLVAQVSECHCTLFVVPAQSGDPGQCPARWPWVPAFAGMTKSWGHVH